MPVQKGSGSNIRVGSRAGLFGQGAAYPSFVPTYLYYDTFTTDLAAGAVNGTNAEPGPGVRAIVDTGSRLSQSLGEMLMTGGGSSTSDPAYRSTSTIAKAAGLTLVSYLREDQAEATAQMIGAVGWDNNNSGDIEADRFRFSTNGSFTISNTTQFGATTSVGTYAANTLYGLAIVYLATKAIYCIKGGAWSDWTLLGSLALHATSAKYIACNVHNRPMAVKNVAVTTLPAALAVDTIADSALSAYMIYALNQIAPVNLLTGVELT